MMRRMKLTMQHDAKTPYVLMLTVIAKRSDRLVRDAKVEFALFPVKPTAAGAEAISQKALAPPRVVHGMNMSDSTMFHYAADFPYSTPGLYNVRIAVARAGAPTVRQEVEFEL